MHSEQGFVVKDASGLYYCGYKTWDKQLRKAKIYTSANMVYKVLQQYKDRNCEAYSVKIIEECKWLIT